MAALRVPSRRGYQGVLWRLGLDPPWQVCYQSPRTHRGLATRLGQALGLLVPQLLNLPARSAVVHRAGATRCILWVTVCTCRATGGSSGFGSHWDGGDAWLMQGRSSVLALICIKLYSAVRTWSAACLLFPPLPQWPQATGIRPHDLVGSGCSGWCST